MKMEADIRAIKVMAWGTAKEGSSTKKAASMMANGKITICMAMVNSIILIINLPTKGSGLLTNSMGEEEYSMMSPHLFKDSLITPISKTWMKNGNTTKET